jgi:hypothetical protein
MGVKPVTFSLLGVVHCLLQFHLRTLKRLLLIFIDILVYTFKVSILVLYPLLHQVAPCSAYLIHRISQFQWQKVERSLW